MEWLRFYRKWASYVAQFGRHLEKTAKENPHYKTTDFYYPWGYGMVAVILALQPQQYSCMQTPTDRSFISFSCGCDGLSVCSNHFNGHCYIQTVWWRHNFSMYPFMWLECLYITWPLVKATISLVVVASRTTTAVMVGD